MTKHLRLVLWGIVSVVVLVSFALFAMYRVGSGISASVEHKTAKTTKATVVSIAPIQKAGPQATSKDIELYRVCYEIDNFDQVQPDIRQGYWSEETTRLSREGSRCKVTSKTVLARNIRPGDKLSIVYLLENQFQIDVVAVSALGEDL